MGDWVVETPSFEEQLMNNMIIGLNKKGVDNVVIIIKRKNNEIERLKKELQDTKEHLGEYLHEQEEENKRLNNIIKRLEEDLREMYLTFGEFSEEYTENCIKKLKEGGDSEKL